MRELRRLLGYLGPYRRDLLIAAVMIILETAFEMVIPVLMADIIDVGVANRDVAVILQSLRPAGPGHGAAVRPLYRPGRLWLGRQHS